jgi:DNA-binding MarR family transcriptional regulator
MKHWLMIHPADWIRIARQSSETGDELSAWGPIAMVMRRNNNAPWLIILCPLNGPPGPGSIDDPPDMIGETLAEPVADPGTRQTAMVLRRSVNRLSRRLRGERAPHGVSSSKLNVLGHLLRAGPMTATDLAALEHVQPQSLTRILLGLEERGLIEREKAEIDRRQVRIEISQHGRDLLAQDSRRQDVWLTKAMSETLTEA